MLRAIDDDLDGQGIYIRKLCDALLKLNSGNEYVAFYSKVAQAGRYRDRQNVREVVVSAATKLLWDQVLVPLAARREQVDVLFHHKFSIPLAACCPTVVQQRGTEYWSHPEFYVGSWRAGAELVRPDGVGGHPQSSCSPHIPPLVALRPRSDPVDMGFRVS